MANDEVIGPRKTMFVLVIVVGCFAVLWPRILSPLVLGTTREQIQPNQFDREAGCCEVIFETDVAVLELVNEVCSSALGEGKSLSVAECRKAVNDTCGVDIAVFLKRNENVGKTTKMLVETMQNSNSSCLREHFGVPIYSLGPHLAAKSWDIKDTLKQERAPPIRGVGPHPALRERGRAIPPSPPGPPPPPRPITLPPHVRVRSPLSVYYENEQPPPIPGMRPPLGSPGGPVAAPKSSMGFVMPIYTICIIVFFVYTLTKILFRRTGAPYDPVIPDPQFRRRVFRDESRTSPEKLGKKEADTIVTAISGLVAEVQQQMEAAGAPTQQRQDVQDNARPYTNGTILLNSGPVQIVTSEYKEAIKEKTPEPENEKESSPEPKEAEPIKVVKETRPEVDEITTYPEEVSSETIEPSPKPDLRFEETEATHETVVLRQSSPEQTVTEEYKERTPELKDSSPEPVIVREPNPDLIYNIPLDLIKSGVTDINEISLNLKEPTSEPEIIQEILDIKFSPDVVDIESTNITLISDSKDTLSILREQSPVLKEQDIETQEPIANSVELKNASEKTVPKPVESIPENKTLPQLQSVSAPSETLSIGVSPIEPKLEPLPMNEESIPVVDNPEQELMEQTSEQKISPESDEFISKCEIPLVETVKSDLEPLLESKVSSLEPIERLQISNDPQSLFQSTSDIRELSSKSDESAALDLSQSVVKTEEPLSVPQSTCDLTVYSSEPEEFAKFKQTAPEAVESLPVPKSTFDQSEPELEPEKPVSELKESSPDPNDSKDSDFNEIIPATYESTHEPEVIKPEHNLVLEQSTLEHKKPLSGITEHPQKVEASIIESSLEPEPTEILPELKASVLERSPEAALIEHTPVVDAPSTEYSSETITESLELKETTPQSKENTPEPKFSPKPETVEANEFSSVPEGTLLDLEDAIADIDDKTTTQEEESINLISDVKIPDDVNQNKSDELLNEFEGADAANNVKDLANTNEEKRFVLVEGSSSDGIDTKKVLDEEDIENAAVKVVTMETTAHPADGGQWPREQRPPPSPAPPHRAPAGGEEVPEIFLQTEIPQQSRVLVAQFHEERPPPAPHSPLVVSGKMTLSLIQDAPRETPERDPESTLDEFTTASAVTQPAAEKGEIESEEEIDEEIEVEEIELEEEELEEEEEEEEEEEAAPAANGPGKK